MEKTSQITHEILKEIKSRKSGRAYSINKISDESLYQLLEAARWAPSSMNEQPWRYILVRKENVQLYSKVFTTLAASNQTWATNAPILLVSLARKTFLRNGVANRHALYDTGAANALLSIQAAALGLVIHQMGGFDYPALQTALNVPDDLEIAAVLSIGNPGNLEDLPEGYRQREIAPRERYTLSELVTEKEF